MKKILFVICLMVIGLVGCTGVNTKQPDTINSEQAVNILNNMVTEKARNFINSQTYNYEWTYKMDIDKMELKDGTYEIQYTLNYELTQSKTKETKSFSYPNNNAKMDARKGVIISMSSLDEQLPYCGDGTCNAFEKCRDFPEGGITIEELYDKFPDVCNSDCC